MKTSAVIVNYESGSRLLECLASLEDQQPSPELIVVDNGSTDGSVAAARAKFPSLKVVTPERNLGFAAGANRGAEAAEGELLLILNPDVRLERGAVEAMSRTFDDNAVGVTGPLIELERSGEREYGYTIDPLGSPVGLSAPADPLFVSGAALMTPADAFAALGGFDERFFMFCEDIDYCWRVLLAGHDVRTCSDAVAWHYGGGSTPGGYRTSKGVETTTFRLGLRERNALAMLIKCYGWPMVAIAVPLALVEQIGEAALLVLSGRRRTTLALARGWLWNLHELRNTLRLRRQIQRTRRCPDRALARRMYRGWHKAAVLTKLGPPVIEEG
jgi:N-acetylglucosaminyl-diphospho-decaprenol L-rhamnosyltransferase